MPPLKHLQAPTTYFQAYRIHNKNSNPLAKRAKVGGGVSPNGWLVNLKKGGFGTVLTLAPKPPECYQCNRCEGMFVACSRECVRCPIACPQLAQRIASVPIHTCRCSFVPPTISVVSNLIPIRFDEWLSVCGAHAGDVRHLHAIARGTIARGLFCEDEGFWLAAIRIYSRFMVGTDWTGLSETLRASLPPSFPTALRGLTTSFILGLRAVDVARLALLHLPRSETLHSTVHGLTLELF